MNRKWLTLIPMFIVPFLAWSPWLTDELARGIIYPSLGGPDANFDYLGQTMLVREVPVNVEWIPFGRAVYFPSEAMWIITFCGLVI